MYFDALTNVCIILLDTEFRKNKAYMHLNKLLVCI